MVTPGLAQRYADFIPDDFVLFWANPVRAHPNVPLRFRFSVYEMYNQPLTWRLTNAPEGMIIAADGRVTWTPTTAQVGSYNITVRVTRADGAFRERTFTTRVNTSEFFFVSPTGNDANPGTLAAPFKTIGKAMFSVNSGAGKTIYIRGGTYKETWNWEINGVYSPFRGKTFTAESPVEVVGYPGETAVLDCQLQGHGFWFFQTSYGVLDNVTVINAAAPERGGVDVEKSENIIIRDTIVQNSNWSYTQNCTGYNIGSANVVVDGAQGFNNKDSASNHWNSSNFLFYLDQPGPGEVMYAINCKSWGSVTGFKVKHAGAKKLIVHKCESFDHEYGYVVGSTGSSIRYSVSLRNHTGIHLGVADPNAYTTGGMLVDHNTVVDSPGAALNIQDDYSVAAPSSVITNNIFVNTLRSAGASEYDGKLLQLWLYNANAHNLPIVSDKNIYFAPSQDNVVRVGNASYKAASFSDWKGLNHDANGLFINPLLPDAVGGNFNVPLTSPALFSDGSFAGAVKPGTSISLVGVKTAAPPPITPTGVRAQQLN